MQFPETHKPTNKCPACGKTTPKRDTRDKTPQYCSRICRGLGRFGTRYQGSMSGPADKPADMASKGKWQG